MSGTVIVLAHRSCGCVIGIADALPAARWLRRLQQNLTNPGGWDLADMDQDEGVRRLLAGGCDQCLPARHHATGRTG